MNIYPVVISINYASGRVEQVSLKKGWDEWKSDLDKAVKDGAVKSFTYTTRDERQTKGLIVNREGKVEKIARVHSLKPARIKNPRRRTWRNS